MKLNLFKFTLNQLILSGMYLGRSRATTNGSMKSFILGYRKGFYIINITYTFMQLKALVYVFMNLTSLRQKILFFRTSTVPLFNEGFFENHYFLDGKWVPGLLTNFKEIRRHKLYLTTLDLQYLPAFVFIYNIAVNWLPLQEIMRLHIPSGALINTESNLIKKVSYPVVVNDNSIESLFFISYLFKKAILKGIQKEKFSLLNII